MKNIFYLFCSLCCFVILSSCNKDNEVTPENQIAEIDQVSDNFSKRTCNHSAHMEKLLADPDYQKAHQEKFTRLASVSAGVRSSECNDPTILPIAVHFQGISNPDANCLRQLAENQIDIINADFQGNNDDISNWDDNAAEYFQGLSNGDACIRFCLASQNHPNGYNLNDGDLAVTINQTSGDNVAAWSGYINIFVRPNLGFLGYSPLGGSGNGDGVVVDAAAFGSGAGCTGVTPNVPYNLGRTLTHELGHYLLLDHIWGGNGGCNDDDQVSDTPVSTQPYYGCPNLGETSCNSNDMHMNYMDYTNDACMYMFSAGQATRVENYIATSLQNVINNAASTCGEVDPPSPTCNDGVQNGDETGVDCGGSCEPCEVAPTCNDGVQNGDETGIDCGGSCEPCEIAPTCNDGVQNGDETGVDCGGSCEPCEIAPTCNDGIQNGDETGIDCGGSCIPCTIDVPCTTPVNVEVVVLGTTEVEASWGAVIGAIKYRVRYRVQGTSEWTKKTAQNNSKIINNLLPGTTYQLQVRTICEDDRSPWSPKVFFTTDDESENGDCEEMGVSISFDDYSNETSWELLDESGAVIASGGNYGSYSEGEVISNDWCLEDGCYSFTMYDDWGDGICCDYGFGSYEIYDGDGNAIFVSDGEFGYGETIEWCVDGTVFRNVNRKKSTKRANTTKKSRKRNR